MQEIVKTYRLFKVILAVFSLLLFSHFCYSAPNLSCVRQFNVDDGLSQSMVYSIFQDSRGYMWFGTQDGLNRFDGHKFTIYKKDSDDPKSVGSKGFFSIAETCDGRLWFATTDGVKIYDPDRDEFTPFLARTLGGEQVIGQVRDVCVTADGKVWMCCRNGNLFCWDHMNLSVFNLSTVTGSIGPLNVRDMAIDSDGVVYVATYGTGLIELDIKSGKATSYKFSHSYANDINALTCLGANSVLVGTSTDGVLVFDKRSHAFSPLQVEGVGRNIFVRSLMCCSDRILWIGTESGLYVYDTRSSEVTRMEHSVSDPYSLSDNAVYAIYEDRDEGVWVGTYFGGVNYVTKSSVFEKHYPVPGVNSIGGRSISEFARVRDWLYIATEDAGLYRYNVRTRQFFPVDIDAQNIHALMSDGRDMWVGTFTKGVYLLDTQTMKIKRKWTYPDGGLASNNIYSIYKDSYGRIWVGAMSGLHYYDAKTDKFVQVRQRNLYNQVNDIVEDSDGLLWFATFGDGLWTYDTTLDKWEHYSHLGDDFHGPGVNVNCILEDHNGRIWVGTDGDGLCMYSKENNSLDVKFSSRNGLLNDVIYSLKCDRLGNIWGSTNKGLFRIEARSMTVSTFTHESGLLCDQFNYKSGYVDRDGMMYFGSIKGFVSFNPERIMPEVDDCNPFISALNVNGNPVAVDEYGNSILNAPIHESEKITLPHEITSFSLELNEIDYAPSQNSIYYYKLEGWDKMWFSATIPHTITYSNLPVGKYKFKVCSAPEEDELIDLDIIVKPSLWFTWWAILIYAILIAALVSFVIYVLEKRAASIKEEKEKALEKEREKELYNAKLDFFTNITHEIRTPLSLIRMPLEDIITKTPQISPQYNNMLIIRENVNRLLSLINQLLDFRKANDRKDIQFVHANVVKIVSKIVARFRPSAEVKNIALSLTMPDRLYVDMDVEMFTKMVSNLLSNAIKHAESIIDLRLIVSGENLIIIVTNDGDVIPVDMVDKIFTPFVKIDDNSEGFGIGLPFVRTLVELHGGTIVYVPREDNMTEFCITIPMTHENALHVDSKATEYIDVEEEGHVRDVVEMHKKSVLLVDDDSSFIDYVANQLDSMYKVKKVYTAERALEYLASHNVDIIVCDINLSGMNGIHLCEKLKGDKRYSSIPLILLSSENSRETKMAGISAGADMYIEKPCYMDYLISCMENLFKSGYISDATKLSDEPMDAGQVYTQADEAFMNRLTELIYAHIEEFDLDVNKLAEMLNMSRATLYRKVKDSLHVTPNDFIRIIRLKKAAEFLRKKEYRINEIAYIVGFNSSSYFSKCFKKQFGVLPKDFV